MIFVYQTVYGRPLVARVGRLSNPTLWSQVLPPQNRFALCGFYFVHEDRKAVQILFLRYTFIIKHYFYMLFLALLCTAWSACTE